MRTGLSWPVQMLHELCASCAPTRPGFQPSRTRTGRNCTPIGNGAPSDWGSGARIVRHRSCVCACVSFASTPTTAKGRGPEKGEDRTQHTGAISCAREQNECECSTESVETNGGRAATKLRAKLSTARARNSPRFSGTVFRPSSTTLTPNGTSLYSVMRSKLSALPVLCRNQPTTMHRDAQF